MLLAETARVAVLRISSVSYTHLLRIISHRSLLNLFYQGEIEVLAGFRNDIPVKGGIIFNEISRLSLCCVLPRSHPYATKEKIYQQELLSESLVTCSSYAIPGPVSYTHLDVYKRQSIFQEVTMKKDKIMRSCIDCASKGCDMKGGKFPDFCLTENLDPELLDKAMSLYTCLLYTSCTGMSSKAAKKAKP